MVRWLGSIGFANQGSQSSRVAQSSSAASTFAARLGAAFVPFVVCFLKLLRGPERNKVTV
jgi:hypothetical protein